MPKSNHKGTGTSMKIMSGDWREMPCVASLNSCITHYQVTHWYLKDRTTEKKGKRDCFAVYELINSLSPNLPSIQFYKYVYCCSAAFFSISFILNKIMVSASSDTIHHKQSSISVFNTNVLVSSFILFLHFIRGMKNAQDLELQESWNTMEQV